MKIPNTISHIRVLNDSFEFQSNEEHQQGVAKMAAKFADTFGMKEYGELLGLLHDKGKEQESFQQHIRYCPKKVCKLQSSYICVMNKKSTKNNEAYKRTKIGINF